MTERWAIKLDYRPDRYWDVPEQAFANIKGAVRRREIKAALEAGEIEKVPDEVLDDALSNEMRTFTGSIHPALMGGEYLPGYGRDEVEIARVELASVTSDVISIRARPAGKRIAYRVVDEYEEEYVFAPKTSKRPLSLKQLIGLIDSATSNPFNYVGLVVGVLDRNLQCGADLENLRKFVSVSSEYYTELGAYYEDSIEEWYAEAKEREKTAK